MRSFSLFITLILLVSCSVKKPITNDGSKNSLNHDEIQHLSWMKSSELYVEGRNFERRGEYQKAYEAYKFAWKLDSTSQYLTEFLIELALLAKQPGEALYFISKGKPVEELPDTTLRKVIEIYSRFNNYTQASYIAEKLKTPTLQDSIVYATLLEKGERYLEAASIIEQLAIAKDGDTTTLKNLTETNLTLKVATLLQKADVFDSSIVLFESVLEKEPGNIAAMRGIGMSLFAGERDLEKGHDFLRKVYDTTNAMGEPDIVSAELLAKFYAQKELWPDAVAILEPIYKRFKEKEVKYYTLYYGKMLALYKVLSGMVKEARPLINELVIIADGSDYEVLLYSGMLYSSSGENEKAKEVYHKVISTNDTVAAAYRSLIGILVDEKKMDEAILIGKLYTEKVPADVSAYSILGRLYGDRGDFASAVPVLEKALAFDSTSRSNRFELAMSYERSGKIAKAVPLFESLVKDDSTNAMVTNYLGYLWAEQGIKLDDAQRLIELALAQDSTNGAYLDSYGWVFYKKREYDKAEKYLLLALEQIKNDYVIYYHLGDLYAMVENLEKALTYYKKAAEFPDTPDAATIDAKIKQLERVLREATQSP